MQRKFVTQKAAIVVALAVMMPLLSFVSSASAAATPIRINTGGPATTVNGTSWSGCTAINACNGYVSGGFPWNQSPVPAVTGYATNTTQAMHQKEWTGGQTNGIANGATAFTFTVPVVSNTDYQVTLHFTELNKTAVGQRVFDVKLNGSNVLTNFDVFQAAGGAYKTITKSFSVHASTSSVSIAFIRRVENAKVDAIEVVPTASSSTTSTSVPALPTTTSTVPATTTTTSTTPGATAANRVNWSTIASPPYRTAESTGGIINNKLYMFGGFTPPSWTQPITSSVVYDIATNKWSYVSPVPQGITHAGRVIDGDNFIFSGGVDEVNNQEVWAVKTVLEYNTDTDSWSYLPDLPEARGSVGTALVGRMLHVFSGVDGAKNVHADHWVLNLDNVSAGWQTAAPFPSPRSHFAAVVVSGLYIYTIGGATGWESTTVEKRDTYRYDITSDIWTRMADMPVVRSHVTEQTMLFGNDIWMFGGEPQYADASSDIWIYNVTTDTWRKSPSTIPQARFASVGDHIGNILYLINGTFYDSTVWKGTIY